MIEVKGLKSQLVHPKETTYYTLTLVFSILAYLGLLFSIVGVIIIGALILFSYCFHALSMASIRRNGIRISQQQFPDIYAKAGMLADKMELKTVPSIYVMESQGLLNAFATRFFGKEMVVIFSEIFDLHGENREDELMFVLAHEFAHLKRRHVLTHFFLLPAMYVPFLGEAYMRACEYTCDRYAAYYVGNLEASKEALVMLAIGKKLSGRVNQEAFVQQINEEQGFFSWMSEKLSTHPDLPKRINALEHWVYPEQYTLVKETKRGPLIAAVSSIILFAVVIGGSIALAYGSNAFASWLEGSDSLYSENPTDVPALHVAIENNDLDELQQLLDDGADIEETDSEGSTALQHAIMWMNYDAVELLLVNGADVNTTDDWGTSPLMNAVHYCENTDIAKLLLENGANPSLKDSSDKTAYDYAVEYKDKNHIDLLE